MFLLSHHLSKMGFLITIILSTTNLSPRYVSLLKYCKNLPHPKFPPTSTLTIFTILVSQHIVLVTALLKVVNDLFHSLNKDNIYVLALPDISSAFDTIDHSILVHRLHTDLGFTDTVLQWFSSYLTDRTQYVSLSNHCSVFAPVHSGVPQGSFLVRMLFTMYINFCLPL